MLKKIICLTLGLLMVLMALTSCSGGGDAVNAITDEASRFTTTLNMWVIADDEMDPEQASAVNAAINKITKSKFKTQLNIKYVSEAEYYAKIEAAFADTEKAIQEEKEAKKNGTYVAPEEPENETVLNEYGIPELKYPTAKDYQVDILFLGDYQKYCEYADREWLVSLDTHLEDSALKLSYYVNGIFTEATKYNGLTYAIPNNQGIGEYTYLLADEKLVNSYAVNVDDLFASSIYSAEFRSFLDEIYQGNAGKPDGEKVYPIYSSDGKISLGLVNYWNFDVDASGNSFVLHPDDFSLYGSLYNNGNNRGDRVGFANVLSDRNYMQRLAVQTYYNTTADYITSDAEANAAFRIVKGGWEKLKEYEEQGYKVLVMESPRATDDTVYDSMFAVGAHTADEGRAMEIITYLNTNAQLRNLLQYGIEGVNYTLDTVRVGSGEDSVEYSYVSPTEENGYHMDLEKTGNVFLAHAPNKESVRTWEYAKKQNLDAMMHPTMGLYFDLNTYTLDWKSIDIINAVSAKVAQYLENNMTSEAAVNDLYTAANAQKTPETMAAFVLGLVGNVTYDVGGVPTAVTQSDLAAAFMYMNTSEIKELKKDQVVYQSPYALYLEWRNINEFSKNDSNSNS